MNRWLVTKLSQINSSIYGITLDTNSNIYFTANSAIWKLNTNDATSQPTVLIGNRELNSMLVGITWSNNKLYTCDWTLHKIYELNLETGILLTLTPTSSKKGGYKDGDLKEALFRSPWGIISHNNSLYVTDKHHIRKIDLTKQTVETIAGSTHSDEISFSDGNALTQAKFSFPAGLALDHKDGSFFVCDFSNHCVRKVKDGVVSTVVGKPQKYGCQSGPISETLFINPVWLVLNDDGTLTVSAGKTIRKVDLAANLVSDSKFGIQLQFGDSCIARDKDGTLYAGTKEGYILKLQPAWKVERVLWIGHLKEDAKSCYWPRLPKELIKEIWKLC